MKKSSIFIGLYLCSLCIVSHEKINSYKSGPDRAISFPDTEEYLTISSDLHTHSVFSDGHVWPNIRVAEALKDNLDSIAITEHLEYQPHTSIYQILIEMMPIKRHLRLQLIVISS